MLDVLRSPEGREIILAFLVEERAAGGGRASPPEWLTTERAAEEQRCAMKTVRRWIREGLAARKRGRKWMVRRADLDAFLAGEEKRERGRSIESILGRVGR